MGRIKKLLLAKDKGNVTSLIFGQMFLLVLVVWALFNFRLQILTTMFDYIDDALTGATLGGALVNVEEYGKSNQLIIHDNEKWKEADGNDAYRHWEKFEADILLSELNYGSDIVLTYSALQPKMVLDINAGRIEEHGSDYYIRRSASSMFGNLVYNLSNGHVPGKYTFSASNIVGSAASLNANLAAQANQVHADNTLTGYTSDGIHIGRDALSNSFIGSYLINDIEVTRFDIYNIWKLNMAKPHVYKSEWFTVNEQTGARTSINGGLPGSLSDFRSWFIEHYYSNGLGGIPAAEEQAWKDKPSSEKYDFDIFQATFGSSSGWASFYEALLKKQAHWEIDKAVVDGGNPLVCYTNTTTTYQGSHTDKRVGFKHFYANTSGNATVTSLKNGQALAVSSVTKIATEDGVRAPIYGWTVYSYKHRNSQYGYTTGTTYTGSGEQNKSAVKLNNKDDYVTVVGGKMDGTPVMNTSVYVEITYTISSLYPKKWYDAATQGMANKPSFYNRVTTARLIDIELNPN